MTTLKVLGLVLILLGQEKVQKLKFEVQHMPLEAGGKPRVLKPEEIREFEAELKGLEGVKEAVCTESSATLTRDPAQTLKLSALRMAGKKTLGTDSGKPVIVFNSIRLEGRVRVVLHVEKNVEKVKEALKGFGSLRLIGAEGEAYELDVRSPIPVLGLVKAVAAKAGVEYKVFEILKDIHWLPPSQ